MSLLHVHLKVAKSHGILVCPLHDCVILPDSVKQHFDKHHHKDISALERSMLQREVDELQTPIRLKTAYSDFEFSKPDGSPLDQIPHLGLHSSLACNRCNQVFSKKSADKNMKEHLRKQHGITTHVESGITDVLSTHARPIFSQRYLVGAKKDTDGSNMLRHFEVLPRGDHDRPTSDDANEGQDTRSRSPALAATGAATLHPAEHECASISTNRLKKQLGKAAVWAREARKEQLAAIPHNTPLQTNPWLAYTRFLELLPMEWNQALEYVRVPTVDHEPALYHLHCTTKAMVRTWQNCVAKTSRYARIRVMQEDMNHVPLYPLDTYQHFSLQHALPLQKMFIFFHRVLAQELPAPQQLSLTGRQQAAWNLIMEHLNSVAGDFADVQHDHARLRLGPLEQLCHDFWLSLVEQTYLDDAFELAFIVPIAYMVVSSKSKGVREGYNFATDITALKKMIRLSSIQKYREQFVAPVRGSSKSIIGEAVTHIEAASLICEQMGVVQGYCQEDVNRSVADNFKLWVYDYLTTEYPTPMNWLINTARYLSRFRYGENLDAFVNWNGDVVTVRGIRTTMSKYISMVYNEYERASSLLCKLTFVKERSKLPLIPWHDLVDDPSNRSPGFSIFSPEVSALAGEAGFIHEQLLNMHDKGQPLLISDLQNARQIQNYCDTVTEFLEVLLGLVHFTSGQPARGTELLSIHYENPPNGMLRNIFLYNGLVAIVPQYHKGYNRDKSLKVIYRFLPREVGSLLVWYLWLIRPFYTLIQYHAPESIRICHAPRVSSTLLWPSSDGTQHATSKPLRQVLQRATEKWMGQAINLSTMRHLLIAFGRKIDGIDRIPTELVKEEVDEIIEEVEDEEREMQAGHSAKTASAVYALDVSQMFTKKFDRAQGQFKVSAKWHKAIGFDNADVSDESHFEKNKLNIPKDLPDRIQCNYKRLLQENFGKKSSFRPQQENVIRAIMAGEPVVAYIAGTGAGKSLAFMLPACFPGYGQTIVIAPLASLRHDIVTQCQKNSIRTSVWKDGHCDQSASIILATPECIHQPAFMEMTHRLSSTGRLERIVVDEFHYVLLPDHQYRPHLLELRRLTQFGARLTLLSATVPYEDQVEAFRLLGVPTDTVPFRVSTSRPNLAWHVDTVSLSSRENIPEIADYVRLAVSKHSKVLVYVDLTTTVELLSAELGCGKYHGQLSPEDRQLQQDDFAAQETGAFVATAAFIVGVHIHNIRNVIWFGRPPHIISLVQGGGRGGRDGKPCQVSLVLSTQIPDVHYNKAYPEHKAMVDAFVQDGSARPVCRRRVLDEYFDNDKNRLSCRTHEQPCDICAERMLPQLRDEHHSEVDVFMDDNCRDHSPGATDDMFTPVRPSGVGRSYFATPQTSHSRQGSSPSTYETSVPRGPRLRRPTAQENDASGSPRLPRRLVFSPQRENHGHGTRWTPDSNTSRARPEQRAIATTPSRSRQPSSTIASSPIDPSTRFFPQSTEFTNDRQERQLAYSVGVLEDANSTRADLFHVQMPATQKFWIQNCVACFCGRVNFQHPRATCRTFVGDLVAQFRTRMDNSWGQGTCWSCFMPANSCPRWCPNGDGRPINHPSKTAKCVDRRAILDTWACLWGNCPAAKQHWIKRIQKTKPGFDADNDNDFREYFKDMIPFGNDYKASNLSLDVNWITQHFFLRGNFGDLLGE